MQFFNMVMANPTLRGVVIGLVIAFTIIIRDSITGFNVRRGKRRGGEVLHYEDMTPEQKKEYGFIPNGNLSPEWKEYVVNHGKLLPNGRLRDPKSSKISR